MRKNRLPSLLVLLSLILLLSACGGEAEETINPDIAPYMARINGADYFYDGTDMPEDYMVEDSQIAGHITSVVPPNRTPSKDDESNIDLALNAPYAPYSDDQYPDAFLISIDGRWRLFYLDEDRQQ